ncbi:MAG: DUF853 family protein [Thermoplasmata archaeon]|nr:DUF853 family protein [Thermoplasmata archaeon]
MPPTDEAARLRFLPASELWLEQFADRLARRVAASRDPTGVLLEWRGGLEGVVVALPTGDGTALVRAAAEGMDGRLASAEDLPVLSAASGLRLGAFCAEPPLPLGTRPDGPPSAGPLAITPASEAAVRGPWTVQLHLRGTGRPARLDGSLRLAVRKDPGRSDLLESELVCRLSERFDRSSVRAAYRPFPDYPWHRREWIEGSMRRFRSDPPLALSPEGVGRLARFAGPAPDPRDGDATRHTVVLGASGAGKTTLLARWGADAIRAGRPVVAVDVHGDLAPAIASLLAGPERRRIVAVDAAERELPVPGLDVMAEAPGSAARGIVAALRRGSEDGGEVYWGFRLRRIFDHFVRIVLEEHGNLRDLYDLLTHEGRREASRLATRDPAQARFLDELRGILRRNPEFLWPAAARISKVALEVPLARVVAPRSDGLPIDPLLAQGRSVLFRIPLAELGPEGAQLAATLLLARIYFGRISAGGNSGPPLLLLVDEAQTVAPSLLAEILADGRKFGVIAIVATQYPGRLEGRLRDAAAGAASTHQVLRTPRASAGIVGPWIGLSPPDALEWLPQLSDGSSIVSRASRERAILEAPPTRCATPEVTAWRTCVAATAAEFGGMTLGSPEGGEPDGLLFLLRSRELAGGSTEVGALADAGVGDLAELPEELRRLSARGWVEERGAGSWTVAPAGLAYLGERAETGAVRESAEHRELLAAAFRIFARNGERLEIVRQGRFDTRLPDAVWRVLSPTERGEPAHRISERLLAQRAGWGWRMFRGRDVFVEAEVSGADRRDRILRDLSKARAAQAFCLFLVGDLRRARRIRAVLKDRRVDQGTATIWVLGPSSRPESGNRPPRRPTRPSAG